MSDRERLVQFGYAGVTGGVAWTAALAMIADTVRWFRGGQYATHHCAGLLT
jgi:hypothetical protein